MAEKAEALPQPRSRLDLNTVGRLLAISLGIASATLMAQKAFGFSFNQDFLNWLKLVENFVGALVLPFEFIVVTPVVNWLHEHGYVFELYPHWKYAFVLIWLFVASDMRNSPSQKVGGVVYVASRWANAALVALLGGSLAGTVPLDHPAVLWWPVAAAFLFDSGDNFIYGFRALRRDLAGVGVALSLAFAVVFAALALTAIEPPAVAGHPPHFFWPVAAFFAYSASVRLLYGQSARGLYRSAFAAVAAAFALGVLPSPSWLDFEHSASPGLANFAAFVAVVGAWRMLDGFLDPKQGDGGFLERALNSVDARSGQDILAVLGLTTIIVLVARMLA